MRIVGNPPSGGKKPTTPTIGTASDGGTGTTVSVAFTPSTYIGKGTITYTATSSPGSITGTGSGSPITVSGLTTGTAYTFTVNGTTNYGVTSDSSAASNSVTPVVPSSFESIATILGTNSNFSVTFSSIPQTYKHLQIRMNIKGTTASAVEGTIQFNSDFGIAANHYLQGNGTSASAVGNANADYPGAYTPRFSGSTYPGVAIVDIIDYASTSKYKTIRTFEGQDLNGSGIVRLVSGVNMSTSAITSLTITGSSGNPFSTGTTIALYGIKG